MKNMKEKDELKEEEKNEKAEMPKKGTLVSKARKMAFLKRAKGK